MVDVSDVVRHPIMDLWRVPVLLCAVLALTGCEPPVARWLDGAPVASEFPSPLAFPPYVAIDSTLPDSSPTADFLLTQDRWREAGAISLLQPVLTAMPDARTDKAAPPLPPITVPSSVPSLLGADEIPLDAQRCARSLRIATAGSRGDVAVWWSRGNGGRVRLLAAWRDGRVAALPGAATAADDSLARQWRGPLAVDTLDQGPGDAQAADRGAYGCARPAPSVVVDDKNGYVHVAYALTGPEGPGVFYAHQMDPRAAFEPPVAILYGDRLGNARVAASGDVVAVAYEDPNSGQGRRKIGLALSRTAGHLFEDRLTASGATSDARDPHVVVGGAAVVVGWSDISSAADPVFRFRRAMVKR